MGDNVVTLFPERPRPRGRVELTGDDAEGYHVGIAYDDGSFIIAGAFPTYLRAIEVARLKGNALGIAVIDFTGGDGPAPGQAA